MILVNLQTINLDYVTINLDCVNEDSCKPLHVLFVQLRDIVQDKNSMDLASCQYEVEAFGTMSLDWMLMIEFSTWEPSKSAGGRNWPWSTVVLDIPDDW